MERRNDLEKPYSVDCYVITVFSKDHSGGLEWGYLYGAEIPSARLPTNYEGENGPPHFIFHLLITALPQ